MGCKIGVAADCLLNALAEVLYVLNPCDGDSMTVVAHAQDGREAVRKITELKFAIAHGLTGP
jgi:hypothetical protein